MVSTVRLNAFVGRKALRGGSIHQEVRDTTRVARASMKGIINNYRKLVDHLEGVTAPVLYEALEPTFAKSLEYCPQDTGALRASGYLEITQFRGTPTVEMGYGAGGSPGYAVAVHENLEWRHKSPTRAKWLQVALAEDATVIQGRIITGLKRAGGF